VTLHIAMERLEFVIWCAGVLAVVRATYFGIKMSQDLKERLGGGPGFPLFVEDSKFATPEGPRNINSMRRWLLIAFALAVFGAVLINYWHG
jgi:hypothetical protein